jgi:hypothetical protein
LAADYQKLAEILTRFYDFTDKTVLYVGAGGRQLLDPAVKNRRLIAIDRDAGSLAGLNIEAVAADFEEVRLAGDVVYFEFCLHEMPDPLRALQHARTLAPETVVFDHSPESEWIFLGAEEEQVRRSTAAMIEFGIRRRVTFQTEQRFQEYAELIAKVSPQGELALERARRFEGATGIEIPMCCELVLL